MLIPESVRTHWWRGALVVVAVVVVCFSTSPFGGLFGLVPLVVWSTLAPSRRSGLIVGAVLLALLAWFVLPGALGLAGRWVPAPIEIYWLHTTIAAVVCAIGARRGFVGLFLLVIAGFIVTGGALFAAYESPPGCEGVAPGPAQLRITRDFNCGSHNCWGVLETTGDRAPEVMRDYLVARHFTPAPTINRVPRYCRTTGLLVEHEVCVDVWPLGPAAARVEWYVN
ncbi:hypothetical protein SAMN05421837_110131 [Amycolatopsis pretoriensis]|uniref:Uncharacterized protein n=1 Tax=Amycolatopsis pretoriensis TaxID=218821 RepID=A0A1H5RDE8_9PSEU|nr:hypothetical protein [Amycolatopsis pretoriensis]SEF36376.1 hypothetical protein SAMN05421837_110131 [Amycolatopsis pretoriensis]